MHTCSVLTVDGSENAWHEADHGLIEETAYVPAYSRSGAEF